MYCRKGILHTFEKKRVSVRLSFLLTQNLVMQTSYKTSTDWNLVKAFLFCVSEFWSDWVKPSKSRITEVILLTPTVILRARWGFIPTIPLTRCHYSDNVCPAHVTEWHIFGLDCLKEEKKRKFFRVGVEEWGVAKSRKSKTFSGGNCPIVPGSSLLWMTNGFLLEIFNQHSLDSLKEMKPRSVLCFWMQDRKSLTVCDRWATCTIKHNTNI